MVPTANRKPKKRRRNFTAAPISFGQFKLSQTHRQRPAAQPAVRGRKPPQYARLRAPAVAECDSNGLHPPARSVSLMSSLGFLFKLRPLRHINWADLPSISPGAGPCQMGGKITV